ncbi:hypothetical protein K5X82_16015 [Halosquirtibacter xylanolyticus]|uniref:hypothetical protein n=1 Tax=Halosquirtibacter xylanolyticus TaxID=3374599 RepID=UPI0037487125|nr:hypothetical protein K5X82_16015 [Prolixibacteraceae bacterium]
MKNYYPIYFKVLVLAILMGVQMLSNPNMASAKNVFVSTSGDDVKGDGTMLNPYGTIKKSLESIVAGDTIFLRKGHYIEETFVKNVSGTEKKPIVITNYRNEEVVMDASQPVDKLSSGKWEHHQGEIYKRKLNGIISQVFVDNEWQMLARWPNANFKDV